VNVPTYDYACEKCGAFDHWQSIKEEALRVCPTCGSPVERRMSANVGFVLKGSGFYQNDYKKPAAPKEEAKPAPASPPCGSCCEAKSCPNASLK
jgi:putative FmdB family regulatory protein